MDDDHMTRWSWEQDDDPAWERWADAVERLLGHDLDGSDTEDGYSLDGAYDMYREGLTPLAASARIIHDKTTLHIRRWGQ